MCYYVRTPEFADFMFRMGIGSCECARVDEVDWQTLGGFGCGFIFRNFVFKFMF